MLTYNMESATLTTDNNNNRPMTWFVLPLRHAPVYFTQLWLKNQLELPITFMVKYYTQNIITLGTAFVSIAFNDVCRPSMRCHLAYDSQL